MFNVLSGLKLGRARTVTSWEQVLTTFAAREWNTVPIREGRMAFTVLEEGDRRIGRMLALVMLENGRAPEVAMSSGTTLLTIRGKLTVMENGREVVMEPWDLVHLPGSRQAFFTHELYLGMWAFPDGNILLRMIEACGRR